MNTVFQGALSGDVRLLARAISLVEENVEGVESQLAGLTPRRLVEPGAPRVIGITGPPGAGKSTLVDRLVTRSRTLGRTVAVLAVDPSSPYTGGAILGDRLRMQQHALDAGVFIRSLSARGHSGGLSRATGQVVELLDAAGWDEIIVETVGVGQSELAVCEVADTAVVVLTPESGDTVQAMKAGLIEIADVFVVNKSDRAGATVLAGELEQSVALGGSQAWMAPVVLVSALEGDGIEEAMEAIDGHLGWCVAEGREVWDKRRGEGRVRSLLDLVGEDARKEVMQQLLGEKNSLFDALRTGTIMPSEAFRRIREQ